MPLVQLIRGLKRETDLSIIRVQLEVLSFSLTYLLRSFIHVYSTASFVESKTQKLYLNQKDNFNILRYF